VSDGPLEVSQANGIPVYLEPYAFGREQDNGVKRDGIEIDLRDERDTRKVYRVVCTFTNKQVSTPPGVIENDDPVLLPPDISGDFVSTEIPLLKDKAGDPVLNSAGYPFESTDDDAYPTLVIAKNFNSISLPLLADYVPSVNVNEFWGLEPRKAKLVKAPWQRLFKANGVPYYRITFEWHINWQTWDFMPADAGWYWYDKTLVRYSRCVDRDGIPAARVMPLDGEGQQQNPDDTWKYWDGVSLSSNNDLMPSFKIKRERNFALLGVPTSL
jgi:hypothetical protein